MDSAERYYLKEFELISFEPYVYRFFKNDRNILLMEVTCGSHGLWQVWIRFNEQEVLLYKNEGDLGVKKIAKLFMSNCYNSIYHKRYVWVYD